MGAYTFDRFIREYRKAIKQSSRLIGGSPLIDSDELHIAVAKMSRDLDAIRAAMSPEERADPSNIRETRRLAIADAANITDQELGLMLQVYSRFARSAVERRRLWWKLMASPVGLVLLLMLLSLIVIVVIVLK